MTTYDKVAAAAQRLVTDDTKDTWALADAVLAHVPEQPSGQRNDLLLASGGGSVPERLATLVEALKLDGVTTPTGDPYSVSALAHLRDTAMTWPGDTRHPEAAYRTHQEAGSPNTEGGRVLAALAVVARGEGTFKPRGLDKDAWEAACKRVADRRKGFPVAANDVRVALQRKTNLPGRKLTTADVKAAIAAGNVEPSAVVEALPEKVVVDEFRQRRQIKHRQQVVEATEGMTDAEVADSDEALDALTDAADGIRGNAAEMEAAATGGVVAARLERANTPLLSALMFARKGMDDTERLLVLDRIGNLRHVLDLLEIAATGSEFSESDQEFLGSLSMHPDD